MDQFHGEIQCVQDHHLCLGQCSSLWVDHILAEPTAFISAKCPICKVLLNDLVVERVMDDTHLQKYLRHKLQLDTKRINNADATFCLCPFCNYFEYRRAPERDILFVQCKAPLCSKISCFVCKNEVDDGDESNVNYHIKCASLGDLKRDFDDTILAGVTVSCPTCNLAGVKDYGCLHMHCPNCDTHWCYVCGKNLGPVRNIESHFCDWKK